jgi:hypothetical protein
MENHPLISTSYQIRNPSISWLKCALPADIHLTIHILLSLPLPLRSPLSTFRKTPSLCFPHTVPIHQLTCNPKIDTVPVGSCKFSVLLGRLLLDEYLCCAFQDEGFCAFTISKGYVSFCAHPRGLCR